MMATETYADWESSAEVEYSEEVCDTCRDVYIVDSVRIFDHTCLPRNFLKPSYKYTVLDLQYPNTPANQQKIKDFGGELSADWYCPEGYKMPIFREDGKDPLEKAWHFIKAQVPMEG